jgi:asparagine synthase (glutamine-hydrolysing)
MTRASYLLAVAPTPERLRDGETRVAALATAQGLALEIRRGRTLLFASDPRLTAARDDNRFVLGRAYIGNRPLDPAEIGLCSPKASFTSLFRLIWGDFVMVEFGGDDTVSIGRAPCGRLPCYLLTNDQDGWCYAASDVRLLFAVSGKRPQIDAPALAHHLARPQLRTNRTCLAGISELAGGTAWHHRPAGTTVEQHWSPWDRADPGSAFTNADTAAETLRETVLGATRALAAGQHRLVLALSGGLDSSIVAAGLATAHAPVTAINLATADRLGDERPYAQMVADHLDLPLRIAPEDPRQVELWRSDAAHLPRPVAKSFAQSADREQSRLADELDASAFVSGGGGDQVFAYMHSCTPLIDYLAIEGWNTGALCLARDIAHMTGIGLPALVAKTFRRAARRDNRYRWNGDIRGLSAWARSLAAIEPAHAWGYPPKAIPPGKAMHVAWLQFIENYLEGYGRETARPILWPLMTQPVIETCLSIPTWMWCAGGRNRAVARQAFRPDLPPQILDRIGKGSPESVVIALFETQPQAILDALCHGALADLGLVDEEAVRSLAAGHAVPGASELNRIMGLLDVEVWVRDWRDAARTVSPPALRSRPTLVA